MRKLIFIVLACSVVSGCSSTSEQSQSTNGSANEPLPQIDGQTSAQKPAQSENTEAEEIVAPVPVAVSMYAVLNEAIKNQNDQAIQKSATEILTQNPKDTRALNAMGLVYYKKGRFDAAQFLFNRAIAANNTSSELYNNLGLVHLAKNERREALLAFRKALEVNSRDHIAAANVGSIYAQEKDYIKAAIALEIAFKKGTKDIKILNNYANALTATGRVKEASEIFEKILKENPTNREAMLNHAILLIENMQKNKEGLDLLNRLKFVGVPQESRDLIKSLENRAKAGLK